MHLFNTVVPYSSSVSGSSSSSSSGSNTIAGAVAAGTKYNNSKNKKIKVKVKIEDSSELNYITIFLIFYHHQYRIKNDQVSISFSNLYGNTDDCDGSLNMFHITSDCFPYTKIVNNVSTTDVSTFVKCLTISKRFFENEFTNSNNNSLHCGVSFVTMVVPQKNNIDLEVKSHQFRLHRANDHLFSHHEGVTSIGLIKPDIDPVDHLLEEIIKINEEYNKNTSSSSVDKKSEVHSSSTSNVGGSGSKKPTLDAININDYVFFHVFCASTIVLGVVWCGLKMMLKK